MRPDATLQVRLGTSLRPRNRIRSSPPPSRRRFWNEIEIKIGFKDRNIQILVVGYCIKECL